MGVSFEAFDQFPRAGNKSFCFASKSLKMDIDPFSKAVKKRTTDRDDGASLNWVFMDFCQYIELGEVEFSSRWLFEGAAQKLSFPRGESIMVGVHP